MSIDASVTAKYTAWDSVTPTSADYASFGIGGVTPPALFPVAQYCSESHAHLWLRGPRPALT